MDKMYCPKCGGPLFELEEEILKRMDSDVGFGCPICEQFFGFTVIRTWNHEEADKFFVQHKENAWALMLTRAAVILAGSNSTDQNRERAVATIVVDDEDETSTRQLKQRTLDILIYAGGLV